MLAFCRAMVYTQLIKFVHGGCMISLLENLISEEEAKRILDPHLTKLAHCFQVAWQQWETFGTDASAIRYPLSARTRACFINDHICHQIRHQFADVNGVTYDDRHGFLLLNI